MLPVPKVFAPRNAMLIPVKPLRNGAIDQANCAAYILGDRVEAADAATSNNTEDSRDDPKTPELTAVKPVVDKNIEFLRKLEEKKRLLKQQQEQERQKKEQIRLKLQKSVLKRAKASKEAQAHAVEEPDLIAPTLKPPTSTEKQEETPEQKQKRLAEAKRLKEKQQQYLEHLAAKKQLKEEEAQQQRLLEEKKKQAVRSSAIGRDVSSRIHKPTASSSAAAGSAIAAVRQKKTEEPPAELTPEEKEQAKQRNLAFRQKQQQHLAKLAEQRKLKQKQQEEKTLMQTKLLAKAREAALANQQEARQVAREAAKKREEEQLLEKEAQEKEATEKPKVDVNAMVNRLSKMKAKDSTTVPEARDFASWKKRHGLDPSTKVFSLTGWYPVIKSALEKRGWYYNSDRESPYFDLKWTLKSDDLKNLKLNDNQYINHFMQNSAITTKVGLLHNLNSLSWFENIDLHTFFPRAYDLNDDIHMQMFQDDFKSVQAETLLKKLLPAALSILASSPLELHLNAAVFHVMVSICSKRQQILSDEQLESTNVLGVEPLVTPLEWEVLTHCDLYSTSHALAASINYAEFDPDPSLSLSERRRLKKEHQQQITKWTKERARISALARVFIPFCPEKAQQVVDLARGLEGVCPQYHLNGQQSKNVWIIKPAGLSRGRGIRVFNDLKEMLEYADVANHKESQWVVQKYIENPMLVGNRKFDIRQWVLVTSWNPLTIYFYQDCYLRFCVEEYHLDDLSDQFIHLANNSISKTSDKFHQVYQEENGGAFKVEGNMWHSDDFQRYLLEKDPSVNLWTEVIQAKMKQIVAWSLQCVQDTITHRKNTCELYGYDFMIDDQFQPWLIEVNSSPACDYSTPITQRYVEEGLEDIVKVIVDLRLHEQEKKKGIHKSSPPPSTGKWELVHKGEFVPMPVSSFGAEFEIKGSKVKKKRGSRAFTPTAANVLSSLTLSSAPLPSASATALPVTEETHQEKATQDPETESQHLSPEVLGENEEEERESTEIMQLKPNQECQDDESMPQYQAPYDPDPLL